MLGWSRAGSTGSSARTCPGVGAREVAVAGVSGGTDVVAGVAATVVVRVAVAATVGGGALGGDRGGWLRERGGRGGRGSGAGGRGWEVADPDGGSRTAAGSLSRLSSGGGTSSCAASAPAKRKAVKTRERGRRRG